MLATNISGNSRPAHGLVYIGAYPYKGVQDIVLPLAWLGFQVTLTEDNYKKAELQWITALEANVRDFIVHRSSDGNTYQTISPSILGKNSFGKNTYAFRHEMPLIGVSYYRVLENDNDGQQSFSLVRSVNNLAVVIDFKVFPNPVKSKSAINILTNWDKVFDFSVSDVMGKTVFQHNQVLGTNAEINGLSLTSDDYIYECRTSTGIRTGKLVVVE